MWKFRYKEKKTTVIVVEKKHNNLPTIRDKECIIKNEVQDFDDEPHIFFEQHRSSRVTNREKSGGPQRQNPRLGSRKIIVEKQIETSPKWNMAHMGNLAEMTQSLRNFKGYDEAEVRNTPSTTALPGFENSVGSDQKKLNILIWSTVVLDKKLNIP